MQSSIITMSALRNDKKISSFKIDAFIVRQASTGRMTNNQKCQLKLLTVQALLSQVDEDVMNG